MVRLGVDRRVRKTRTAAFLGYGAIGARDLYRREWLRNNRVTAP